MRFQPYYFFWFILIFLIELYIAVHVQDAWIRPYLGDVLVVILIYAMVRAFFRFSIITTAIGVLIFSFFVETLQYFQIVELLGLGHSSLAKTVIGTTFVWEDLIAYSVGTIILLILEKAVDRYPHEWQSCKSTQK